MMLAITGSAIVSALGAVCLIVGLGMVVVPWCVRVWDERRDPDGARALAKRDRGKVGR